MNAVLIAGSSAAGGAAIAFFYDKDLGHRRRAMARQRLGGMERHLRQRGERLARHAASEAEGWAARVAHPQSAQAPPPDDTSLARKVETVIFRDPDVPKGHINVNAEHGVVYLRGKAATPEQINKLEHQAREIPGVRDVRNLLSLPGTPARR